MAQEVRGSEDAQNWSLARRQLEATPEGEMTVARALALVLVRWAESQGSAPSAEKQEDKSGE